MEKSDGKCIDCISESQDYQKKVGYKCNGTNHSNGGEIVCNQCWDECLACHRIFCRSCIGVKCECGGWCIECDDKNDRSGCLCEED